MPDVLLKRWNNWQDGVGHPIDEGGSGMHTANKILGLRGELRPAPVATDVTVTADPGQHFQYFFEEPVSAGQTPKFDAGSNGSDSTAASLTISHTVADKPDRILVVGALNTGAGIRPTSITFGGVALAELDIKSLAGAYLNVWILLNPVVSTANVVITYAASRATIIGIVGSYYDVDQSSPFGTGSDAGAVGDAGPATTNVASGTSELVLDMSAVTDSVQTMTKGAGQTEVSGTGGVTADDLRFGMSYETGAATTTMSWSLGAACTWRIWAAPLLGATPGPGYLYAQRGKKGGSASPVKVNKVSLANADFANLETGSHSLSPLAIPGQPVRYQGYWWFPMGDNQSANKLSDIVAGAVANDTLDGSRAGEWGADHLANLGSQLLGTHAHSTNDAGGVRILKIDGDPEEEDDWGSAFQVGDKSERAGGVRSLAGLAFILSVEGIHSCDKTARFRLVFEDFRNWRHVFDNIVIKPWMGGLVMSHPTGLIFWEPGKLPVNIGLNADIGGSTLSPSGPPGLRGGRYHGIAPVGDFLWHIYQPDITSTTVNVMVGYPREPGNPYDLVFQQLGTTTLQDTDHMLGCFVSVSSKPLSPEYVTPTLWYGNDDDLSYVVLGTTASPFRTRADTHVVEAAGDAYMSELLFERPTELSQAIVYTQNMSSGDEWQLKILADGEDETNLGSPIKFNGRHVIKIDRHDAYRLMLRVNWATTVTAARAAPSIQRIELYGPTPVVGKV